MGKRCPEGGGGGVFDVQLQDEIAREKLYLVAAMGILQVGFLLFSRQG